MFYSIFNAVLADEISGGIVIFQGPLFFRRCGQWTINNKQLTNFQEKCEKRYGKHEMDFSRIVWKDDRVGSRAFVVRAFCFSA